MAIGDGAVAEIINLQNAAAALNPVKFEMAAAQEFVAKQNWVGLETYLSEFLTKVQGDKFYHHPGLFRSLYQAQISSLIVAKQFDEARDVLRNKVSPLVAHREDLYAPLDLEYRVQVLEACVWKCLPPSARDVEDMNVVLSDYMMLYFPTSLQNDEVKRTNSISDFLVTLNDGKGIRHRCLACHQVMPAPVTSSSIVSHIKDIEEDDSCPKVTEWMREYLAHHVRIEKETDSTASSSWTYCMSRKRKAPLSPPPTAPNLKQQSDVIRLGLVIPIYGELTIVNMKALKALYDPDKSQYAGKPEAREIQNRQEKLISELRKELILIDTPDSSSAYMSIKALRNLSDDLLPLIKYMPADVSELLLEQDKKITELRRSFMLAAAGRHPPTAPDDDHGTSSTDSC
ncbi:unnamed protein product [Urochloa decumbens]|uniref:Uncharacterized protein n=1 Tax=Urochloa decumbens TaxID=240449 RepID=A0ABC9GEL0_9POAL